MISNPPEIFNYLSHKIVAHLMRNCKYKESNKTVFANSNTKEIALFFKLDRGYLTGPSDKKADILVYYCNLEEKCHRLMVIELKGRDVRHAIEQIESTITNSIFSDFWNSFNGTKSAGIIASGSSPPSRRYREMVNQFRRHNKVPLNILYKTKANIKDFFKDK